MIDTTIKYIDGDTLHFTPHQIGNLTFQNFCYNVYANTSPDYNLEFYYRTVENIECKIFNNIALGKPTIKANTLYYPFACFKNKRLSTIGICEYGQPLSGDYDGYTKIWFPLPTNSSGKFMKFSDARIENNLLVNGGWYGITDNNLYDADWSDFYVGSRIARVRRINDTCYVEGIIKYNSTITSANLYYPFTLPKGFVPTSDKVTTGITENAGFILGISSSLGQLYLNTNLRFGTFGVASTYTFIDNFTYSVS